MKSTRSTLFTLLALFAVLIVELCSTYPLLAEPIVMETLFEDGTTNTWTQADLKAALGLLNRKYHREVKTESGRVAWHGKRIKTEENTNTLAVVSTYADGTQFTDPFTVKRPASLEARMAAAKRAKAAQRMKLPPGLAEIEAQRDAAAQTTNEVTVIVEAD